MCHFSNNKGNEMKNLTNIANNSTNIPKLQQIQEKIFGICDGIGK